DPAARQGSGSPHHPGRAPRVHPGPGRRGLGRRADARRAAAQQQPRRDPAPLHLHSGQRRRTDPTRRPWPTPIRSTPRTPDRRTPEALMHIAVYLALLCSLLFAAAGPVLAPRHLNPHAGMWTLTAGAGLSAAASTWA